MAELRYVHGYAPEELDRLVGSANTLAALLHGDTRYPPGARVLEAGCGVGAQTRHLYERCPGVDIVSIDLARPSLMRAKAALGDAVAFVQANLYALPFGERVFDHIFLCYVLEHLPDPLGALQHLRALLKPGGTISAIEGDHGSAFWHPETAAARAAWACLQQLQTQGGGDGHIGRRLHALFRASGAVDIQVKPLPVYCDPTLPDMMDGFADKTIVGMLKGIEAEVLARNMIARDLWHQGVQDLLDLAHGDEGSFMYTFFRATALYA